MALETYKPQLSNEDKKDRAKFIAAKLKDGGKLLISVTYVSKSNMNYRYKVVLAYVDDINPNELMFETLTYWMAAELGVKAVSEYAGDTLKGSGCGFNRYHEAAYTVGILLQRHGLITEPLKTIANRNIYREI